VASACALHNCATKFCSRFLFQCFVGLLAIPILENKFICNCHIQCDEMEACIVHCFCAIHLPSLCFGKVPKQFCSLSLSETVCHLKHQLIVVCAHSLLLVYTIQSFWIQHCASCGLRKAFSVGHLARCFNSLLIWFCLKLILLACNVPKFGNHLSNGILLFYF